VIAHRLSTIQHADCIYVLEQGKVVQKGKHAELIGIEGPYKEFVQLQAF
jgi:ABC-type multidrug transport system fused ATPase/permease subunit